MNLIFAFWRILLLPPKFYGGGGGGGTKTVAQTNPEERALAEISDEKWEEYKRRYVPLENQYIGQVKGLNDPIQHSKAAGQTAAEVKRQRGPQTMAMADSMMGQRLGQADYLGEARDVARARTTTDQGVTDRYLKGVQGVIAMGQGQSSEAIQGLGDVASTSVQAQINDSKNQFRQQQDRNSNWGAAAGAGMAAMSHSNMFNKEGN